MNARPFCILLLLLLLSAGMVLPMSAWSAEVDGASAPVRPAEETSEKEPAERDSEVAAPLRFTRVYVPADRPQDWPHGRVRYLPIDPDEFERLLGFARNSPETVPAAVVTAEYTARLNGESLEGKAVLQVDHRGERPVLLSLDTCRLATGRSIWAGRQPEAAVLGLRSDGKPAVRVQRPGRLEFDWSLYGRRDAAEMLGFAIGLPQCPSSRLILDLPDGATPLAEHGIVTPQGRGEDGLQRWRIELGPHHRLALRIARTSAAEHRRPAALRESLIYDFSPRGLTVSAQLQLDVTDQPLRQLSLTLDEPLRLVTAQYGQQPVSWSTAPDPEGRVTRVTLELPGAIVGTGRVVRFRALAPLVMDRAWRLPAVRPEGVFWQEGTATLLVPTPLLVEQLTPIRCRQSKTGPLPGGRSGESIELQYFTPDATARIVLVKPRAAVEVNSATRVELSGGEMTARLRAEFRIAETEKFLIEVELAPHWIVDSVASTPGDMVDDWDVPEGADGSRKLVVRLAKALSSSRGSIGLSITARRLQSPLGRNLTLDDLRPLRFPSQAAGKRLVELRAVDPYRLHTSGTEQLTQVDPGSLDGTELKLFAEPPRGLLFVDDAGGDQLRVSLRRQSPRYAGRIRVEATAAGRTLRESYRLECIPESARVELVLVHFSHTRSAPLRWTLGGEQQQLVARQLPPAEQAAAGLGPEGQTWEISLRPARSVPFEIRANRTTKLIKSQPVSLAVLPEATGQQAILIVRSEGSTRVRIDNNRLHPVPAEEVPEDRYQTARATYRYDPARLAAWASEAAISVSPQKGKAVDYSAVAWCCRLRSRYEPDGAQGHLATFWLQSSGRRKLRLTLPPAVTISDVQGVWVDDHPVAWQHVGNPIGDPIGGPVGNCLLIDLPEGAKFPVVSVRFQRSGPPLGIARRLEPCLPKVDLPVLSRQWTVWLPPGYGSALENLRWQPPRRSPPTWSQRIFGPLGRPARSPAFDPLAGRDWVKTVLIDPDRRSTTAKAEQLLHLLGVAATNKGTSQQGGGPDWGTLLTDRSIEPLGLPLLLDRRALAYAGISPRTLVPLGPADDPADDPAGGAAGGAALLKRAELVLLVHRDGVLLTSAADAALYRAHLEPLDGDVLWWVLPGPLADRLHDTTQRATNRSLVLARTWGQDPAEPELPWVDRRPAGHDPTDMPGWTACRLESSAAEPVQLAIVHWGSVAALRWTAFLLAIALGWWKAADRPLQLTVLAGLSGAAALLTPAVVAAVASGVLLGSLFCLGLRLVYRKPEAAEPPTDSNRPPASASSSSSSSSSKIAGGATGVALLVALTVAALSGSVRGDEPARQSPPGPLAPYRVFIPVDEEHKTFGGKYFLPEDFYNKLYRRAVPESWLICGATYHGALSEQPGAGRLMPGPLRAVFELWVFGRGVHVPVPLVREQVDPKADAVILDGRVIRPQWEQDGRRLVLDIAEPGRHRLELVLHPKVHGVGAGRNDKSAADFELAIPRLADSRLELILPADGAGVEVPSALGSVRVEGRRLVAQLGPTDRLSVRWQEGVARGGAAAVDVEELLWLKIQPGSVVVDAKFKVKVVKGQLGELLLAADPRFRLESISPGAQLHELPGKSHVRRLELSAPCSPGSDVVDVQAGFLLQGSSGVGNLRLPMLGIINARTTRRWMALSVNPELKYKEQAPGRPRPVLPADFVAAWGTAERQPLAAYDLAAGESSWSISSGPRESRTTVDQTLALSFSHKTVAVRFDAQLATTVGYNFQYRLSAPAGLEVEKISLVEEGRENVERVARWSRAADGRINVFLTGPATEKQRLSLRGRLPTPAAGKIPLPTLRIEGAELKSEVIHVFRQPAVLLKVDPAGGSHRNNPPGLEQTKQELGRPVASFAGDGDQPVKANLTLRPNHPKVHAEQITSLSHDGKSFIATVDCRISTSGGVVDEIRLDVPNELIDRCKIDPPAAVQPIHNADSPGQLLIRPQSAIEGQFRFTLSCPAGLRPGGHVAAVEITLRRVDTLSRLIVLPRRLQGRPIAWEVEGLRKSKIPKHYVAPPQPPESPTAYTIVDRRFQVVLTARDRVGGGAEVYLADVNLAWRADETCYGVVGFDLDPAGRSSCPLWMPDRLRLVQLTVAGVPTTPLKDDTPGGSRLPLHTSGEVADGANMVSSGHRYRVPLGPENLPQRIEVLFDGCLPDPLSGGRREFQAPTLGDLPVRRTLWSVSGPPLYEQVPTGNDGLVSPLQHELIRLRSIAALVEPASKTSDGRFSAQRPGEMIRWYRPWARRLTASRDAVGRRLPEADSTELAKIARRGLAIVSRKQKEIEQRLAAGKVSKESPDATLPAGEGTTLWYAMLQRPQSTTRCAFERATGSITLDYRGTKAGWFSSRLPAALGVVLLVALTLIGVRRGHLTSIAQRWPHLLGVVAGLAWWLLLSPSILGWAIVLLSLLGCLHSGWRRYRQGDSAVVPLG